MSHDEQQLSFGAGELDPELHGKTDLPQYRSGARRLLNFLVSSRGSLINRTGTQHIKSLDGPTRLVAFVMSRTDRQMLAVTQLSALQTEWTGVQPNATDGRFVFDVFAWSLVSTALHSGASGPGGSLRHAQDHAEMMFTNRGGYTPHVLTRDPDIVPSNAGAWSIALHDVAPKAHPSLDFAHYGYNGDYPRVQFNTDPVTPNTVSMLGDSDNPVREWRWLVTVVMEDSDGNEFETIGYPVTKYYTAEDFPANVDGDENPSVTDLPEQVAVHAGSPIRIWMPFKTGDDVSDGSGNYLGLYDIATGTIVATRVYRGRDGQYGRVGEIRNGHFFEDVGAEPDYSNPPPGIDRWNGNPFSNPAGDTTLRPSIVAHHERRRLFASSGMFPYRMWGSAIGSWKNFEEVPEADDDDAYFMDLAGRSNLEIRALVAGDPLLLFSTDDEYRVAGNGEGGPITPNAIMPRGLKTFHGCADIEPVSFRGGVAFIEVNQCFPWMLRAESGQLADVDLSVVASHLFKGFTCVDIAFQNQPTPVFWVVRSDGVLLSMTYSREFGLMAWAQHEIAGDGLVEAVETMPEGEEDGVYLVVNRGGSRSLERLARRALPRDPVTKEFDVRYACYMDRAVTFNGYQDSAVTIAADKTRSFDGSQSYDASGGSYADDTSAVNNATDNDVSVFGGDTGDIRYFGSYSPFTKIIGDSANGTPGVANGATVIHEYYDGVTGDWEELPGVVDDTDGFTAAAADDQELSWVQPVNWALTTVNGSDPMFFVRVRVVAGTYTTAPIYDQFFIGQTGLTGDQVTATFDDFTGYAESIIQIDNTDGGTPVRLYLVSEDSGNEYTAQVLQAPAAESGPTAIPSDMLATELDSFWLCAESVDGLEHLEGQEVVVLADGNVVEGLTVNAGTVSIAGISPYEGGAVMIHAGLSYSAEYDSLDAIAGRGAKKVIKGIWLNVESARGVEVGDEIGDDMVEIEPRQTSDGFETAALVTDEYEVRIRSKYGEKGRCSVRQAKPLPCTVLGVMRDFDSGGR